MTVHRSKGRKMIDYELFQQTSKLLFEAALRPVQGDRFQPTGFADIGAAVYTRPDSGSDTGTQMLLVESAQSVANRLEKTCLDGDGPYIDPALQGLPYVVAKLKGAGVDEIETSSLVEAHRLGSPYILYSDFADVLSSEMKYSSKGQLDWKRIYSVFFKYDPNCLVHGVFLALLDGGRVRVARALSGFIEAENVRPASSGGVKNSLVDPTGKIQAERGKDASGIYSNVPYSRMEYVASKIKAYFNLDTSQIRSYRLSTPGTQLLIALSLLKIRRFLDSDLRLRTACSLEIVGDVVTTCPKGYPLPPAEELLPEVQKLIGECKQYFGDPAMKVINVPVKRVPKGDKKSTAGPSTEEVDISDND